VIRLLASASLFLSLSCFAADVSEIVLDGKTTNFSLVLDGAKSRTIYQSEEYETTCTREEPYTAYSQECDTQTVQSCHEEERAETCHSVPSCRDVSRPVCNSNGCTDYSTRECTTSESCSGGGSHTVCSSHLETTNCRDVPYTAYQTVTYSCTQTRSVPVGTELVEELSANVSVEFVGNLEGLSGKDRFKLSLANGLDVYRDDLVLESTATGDTHFFRFTKVKEEKKSVGEKKSQIESVLRVEAITVASIVARRTLVSDMTATRGDLTFTTTGEAIDPTVKLSVVTKKDRLIGGLKEDSNSNFKAEELKVTPIAGGESVRADLDVCLNKRPHEFTLTLTRDVNALLGGRILNSSTVEKAQSQMTSTYTKRVKLSGKRSEQCK